MFFGTILVSDDNNVLEKREQIKTSIFLILNSFNKPATTGTTRTAGTEQYYSFIVIKTLKQKYLYLDEEEEEDDELK